MFVPVAPYLINDQLVYAQYLACGDDWKASNKEGVVQVGHFLPVSIVGIENDRSAVINDGLAGARIDLYNVSGNTREFLGRGIVDPLNQHVFLNRPLTKRDHLIAYQTLCYTFDHSPIQEVLSAEKIFQLPAPLRSLSNVAPYDKFLEVDIAELWLAHSGEHQLRVHARNTEDQADVDYIFQVTLQVANRPGEKWEKSVTSNLSVAGNGPVTLVGYRTQGVPSQSPASTPIAIDQRLNDILFWRDILQSNDQYRIMHCFFKRPPEAEADDPMNKGILRVMHDY